MTLLSLALSLAMPAAQAGYGDVIDGYPRASERALHLWTNAARVDPSAFEGYYDCPMSGWQAYEREPQRPISMDYDLLEAARFHSQDMSDNNHFAHESSDGTPFASRLARFYDNGSVGENIAYGYPDEFDVVFGGWMCSDGHRANIMLPDWVELGTGVVGTYYTQNFGGGAADTAGAVKMGAHWPVDALVRAELYADWHDDAAPERFNVVVDGKATAMTLEYGAAEMGVYLAELEHDNAGCHAYFFVWETAEGDTGAFPEGGSYLYGEGCADQFGEDAAQAGFVEAQEGGGGGAGGPNGGSNGTDSWEGDGGTEFDVDDIEMVGCSSGRAPAGLGLALLGLGLVGWRRRD